MRRIRAGLLSAAALALGAPDVRAAAQAECDLPFAFAGPVQVFILDYGFEPTPSDWASNARLSESAQRLSYLIQRDVLANDSFGSLAVILLIENRPGACDAAEVQQRLLDQGILELGQAMVLIWGRIYQEDEDIFVQSYVRLLRVDPHERRYMDEHFEVILADPEQRLRGVLPRQSVAFAPRKLRASDLERIDGAWQEAARLYDDPREDASSQPLPPPEEPLAYFVHEMRPDGWLGVELQFGERGWLRADPQVSRALRTLVPELHYIEAVIGYLSYRQAAAADETRFPGPPAPWMLERIEDRLARFTASAAEAGEEPRTEVSVLATSLLGSLQAFETDEDVATGLERLRDALRQRPEDGSLRNLVAMAELRACCTGEEANPVLRQVPELLLSGLAVDPNNQDLLRNLEATYAWLVGEPAGSPAQEDDRALAQATVRVNANLRAAPTTESARVGLAAGGAEVAITGTDASGEWLRVVHRDEAQAFVAASLVQDVRPSPGATRRLVCSEVEGRTNCRLAEGLGADPGSVGERLAATGLSAGEVGARLEEVKELRAVLGSPD